MAETVRNDPTLWLDQFPWPKQDGYKYDRGHALVYGGPLHSTGAARLSAMAALRMGAGLVSVVCTREALPIYAASLTAVMTKPADQADEYAALLADKRMNAALLGPGAGVNATTRERVLATLGAGKATVLDADALSVFADRPHMLFGSIRLPCILTPHAGEFAHLFGPANDRVGAARDAAKRSHAVVVLKGADTIIAAPDGRCAVNHADAPWLATAGTGDVLAGFCLGLLAQGMAAYEAACAAVWLHAETARRFGHGMIAEDLPAHLPASLQALAKIS